MDNINSLENRVEKLEKILNSGNIFTTLKCPYCGGKYRYEADNDNIFYYCENYECQKKTLGRDYPTLSLQDIACMLNYNNT